MQTVIQLLFLYSMDKLHGHIEEALQAHKPIEGNDYTNY